MSQPKILLLDIETAPILGYVWGLYDNDLGVSQIASDWHVLAWAAKWLDAPASKIIYRDQRRASKIEDDKKILKEMWELLNEADVIITQNGKAFDEKKLNARFILNGFKPPASYKHIDTKQIASKKFGFTSNKLEYLSSKLCKKYKKLKHNKFAGFDLWKECLNGNLKAWKEMEKYNKYDVLSLEELYKKLQPWDSSINFQAYQETTDLVCACGSTKFQKNGYCYSSIGKYQRYSCSKCGSEVRSRKKLQ
jgi:hypothetical protein